MSDFMSEWGEFLAAIILGGGLLIVPLLLKPSKGLQLAFFTSGILLTKNMPVVRDKVTATEFVFFIVWLGLLLRGGAVSRPSRPLLAGQRLSLELGAVLCLWILVSFGLNNLVAPDETLIPSLVETLNFVYGYLTFLTVVLLAREWDIWKGCVNSWVIGAAVVSIFGVWGLIGHAPAWTHDPFTGRVSSTLRTENQVPSYLLPILLVIVFMAVRKGVSRGYRVAHWVLMIGVLLTTVATGSRTGLLMLMISYVAIMIIAFGQKRDVPYKTQLLALMFLVLGCGFILYFSLALMNYHGNYALGRTPAWQRPVVVFHDWIFGKRVNLDVTRTDQASFVFNAISDHLIIGTGPKIYGTLYNVEEVHNTYLGVLIQTGTVGLALFLGWLFHFLWGSWKNVSRIRDQWQSILVKSLVVGMSTLLLYNMTMFGLRQRTIWLLAGLLVASWSFAEQGKRGPQINAGN